MYFPHLSNPLLVTVEFEFQMDMFYSMYVSRCKQWTQVPGLGVGVVASVSQFPRVEGVEGIIMAVLFSLSHFVLQIFSSLHIDVFALYDFYMEFKSPLIICPAANF